MRKIEILNFQRRQMNYCVFLLLVEQKDKISYRRGLGAMDQGGWTDFSIGLFWIEHLQAGRESVTRVRELCD